MPLAIEVDLGPGNFVLDGDPAPLPKRVQSSPPQIWDNVHCGQMAGWIKTVLSTEVGLGPGHIVLDGNPAPPPQKGGGALSKFSAHVHCDQTAGRIKMGLGT